MTDTANMEIDANAVVERLARRLAQLEIENAQQSAIIAQLMNANNNTEE